MKINKAYRHDLGMVMRAGKEILGWEVEYQKQVLRREYEAAYTVFGGAVVIVMTIVMVIVIGGLR